MEGNKKIKKGRTLICGDIHGANRALLQCLERANFDNEIDTLIQLGDVADGWDETSECVDTLLSIKNLISIRGNHDVWCHDWFKSGATPILWTEQGGKATMESYIKSGKIADNFHRMFWEEQKDWHIDEQNRLFIHAGWDYKYLPFPEGAAYPVNAGSVAKECHWDRSLLQGATSASQGGRKNDGVFNATKEFKEVYIGHTAIQDSLPKQFCNVWNLDTGAGWYGKLTIMDIDTKEFWQSNFSTLLYPESLGRGRR